MTRRRFFPCGKTQMRGRERKCEYVCWKKDLWGRGRGFLRGVCTPQVRCLGDNLFFLQGAGMCMSMNERRNEKQEERGEVPPRRLGILTPLLSNTASRRRIKRKRKSRKSLRWLSSIFDNSDKATCGLKEKQRSLSCLHSHHLLFIGRSSLALSRCSPYAIKILVVYIHLPSLPVPSYLKRSSLFS